MGRERTQRRRGVQHLAALLTTGAVLAPVQGTTAPTRTSRPWSLRPASYRLAAAPFLFLAALFVLPLLRVVVQGFQHAPAAPDNFTRIATSGPYLTVLLGTVQTACVVTVVCLLLAYPLAYAGARLQGRWYTLFMGAILVPLFTSVVVRSYAWMVLFQRNGPFNQALIWLDWPGAPVRLLQTPFAVDVGMVHILLPFMVLPILGAMRAIDPSMLQAGELLGAPPWRVFTRIYVPLTLPGASAGVILVFISALGFFITPALLGGARSTTIAVLIEQQAVDLLNWPMASALATVLLVLSVVVYIGYNRLTRRFNDVRA